MKAKIEGPLAPHFGRLFNTDSATSGHVTVSPSFFLFWRMALTFCSNCHSSSCFAMDCLAFPASHMAVMSEGNSAFTMRLIAFDHQPRRTISDGSSPFSKDLQTETFMHSIEQASVCHVQMGATNAGEPEGVCHGWELPYRLQAQSFIEGPAIKMSRALSATKCYKHIWRINSSKNTLVSPCLVASQSGDEPSSRPTLALMPCSTYGLH